MRPPPPWVRNQWGCQGLLTADVEATGRDCRGNGKDVIEIGIQEESL